jgi:hypothetical protein
MSCISVSVRARLVASNLLLGVAGLLLFQLRVSAELPGPTNSLASQSVRLGWDTNNDPDVAGYKIYYGAASHTYTDVVVVGNTNNGTVTGLVVGTTYYFAATSYNGSGTESPFSKEVSYTVPLNTPTITVLPTASPITYGQTLASSGLSGGMASTEGGFAFTTPGLAPDAGTANVAVTFTPTDMNNYTTATATVVVAVNQALAAVTLGNLDQPYDGTAKLVSVTTLPAGLNVGVTYDASSMVPTNAGSYRVVATVNDPNYAGSATNTLVISQATAIVTLGDLNQSYDGTAKLVSVTTSPTGLNVGVTYDASSMVPTNAGSYVVIATVNDPNYTGNTTNVLVINPAVAWLSLTNLVQTYDGTAKPVMASTTPTNLAVVLTYNDSSNAPVAAGSYLVVGTIVDPNYQGSATNTLSINSVTPTITTPQPATLTSAACSGGQFSFTVSEIPGQMYVVQASTNLLDWVSVLSNTAPFVFVDSNTAGFNQRFYRAFSFSP